MTSLAKNTEVTFGYNVLKNIRQVYAVSDYKVSFPVIAKTNMAAIPWPKGMNFQIQNVKILYFSTFLN